MDKKSNLTYGGSFKNSMVKPPVRNANMQQPPPPLSPPNYIKWGKILPMMPVIPSRGPAAGFGQGFGNDKQ